MMLRLLIPLIFLLLAACGPAAHPTPTASAVPIEATTTAPAIDFLPMNQKPGEKNYNVYCAHCHGYDGEGQLASTLERTIALGYNTVPPHNSTGHTWMHTDELLLQAIQEGIQNPLDLYVMAGYGNALSAKEIMDIIEYIKGWWTDEQRAYQRQITKNARERREELGFTATTPTPP